MKTHTGLSEVDIDRIIEMAWEDRTPFDTIRVQFGYTESMVITLMRSAMKKSSFEMWRKRVTGRSTKHKSHRHKAIGRHKSNAQRAITHNKISKR